MPESNPATPVIKPLSQLSLDLLSRSPPIALFLDVDGTLIEIADRPELVVVPPTIIPLLERLHDRLSGAVALISGRSIAVLDTLFAPLILPAAGQHGMEIRGPDGVIVRRAGPVEDMASAEAELKALVARAPGLSLEHKGLSIAAHYRNADQHLGALLEVEAIILSRFDRTLQTIHGKKVIEFKPKGVDKGVAIRELMATPPFLRRQPVFVGDDTTDEDGFEAVLQAGGTAIQVGDRTPTVAQWRTPSVSTLRAWLTALAT